MRRPSALFPGLAVALTVLAGCGAEEPAGPGVVPFTGVDLPGDATPLALATAGDALLVGVQRNDTPGLFRRGTDGDFAEVTVTPAEPYGRQAEWQSLAADGNRIVAVGGKRGGAHGNVRWSVWSGTDAGLVQQPQTFSTFGGLGAGELTDAVLTPAGPALVGTWQGEVGLDPAVWTPEGETWVRRPSAGTPLANTRESLKFPMAAVSSGQGAVVAGWELAKEATGSRQRPVVWQSAYGTEGWTATELPDAGDSAAAVAVRCGESSCAVSGRVDGELAVWTGTGAQWERAKGVPEVAVSDEATLVPPVEFDGNVIQLVTTSDEVRIATTDGTGWQLRPTTGPAGEVTAVTLVGRTLYVVADGTLWSIDATTLAP